MQIYQLNELSTLFFSECYYLNISEVMLFLIKLKRGDFGEFYGCIDPLKIMSAKNEFIRQRRLALQGKSRVLRICQEILILVAYFLIFCQLFV